MKNVSDPSVPSQSGLKMRLIVPAVFITTVTALLLWGIVRGNRIDTQPKNPATSSDGVTTQLLQTSDGQKEIRAAMIVDASPASVWKVVTDYDHFAEVFPNISTAKGVRDADGRWHVTAEVHSMVGHWPMDIHVRQEESKAGLAASWDEPSEYWKVNRGSWVVTPHGDHEALLEYHLQLKVTPFPDFVVRAVLLDQLKPALLAVASHAQRH